MRIDEIRSHPDKNPRQDIVSVLRQYSDREDVYVSFTELNKLGINPQSGYNTPLGIYAYPVRELFTTYGKNFDLDQNVSLSRVVPFAGNQRHATIFSCLPQEGLVSDFDEFTEEDLTAKLELITNVVRDFCRAKYGEGADIDKGARKLVYDLVDRRKFKGIDLDSYAPKHNTPLGVLWFVTMKVSQMLAEQRHPNSGAKQSLAGSRTWNGLLRKIGFVGFCDRHHSGLIHSNEKTQALFLTVAPLKIITTMDNKRHVPSLDGEKALAGRSEYNQAMFSREIRKWLMTRAFGRPITFPADYAWAVQCCAKWLEEGESHSIFNIVYERWIKDQPDRYKYFSSTMSNFKMQRDFYLLFSASGSGYGTTTNKIYINDIVDAMSTD